jgi:hypothetical protein
MLVIEAGHVMERHEADTASAVIALGEKIVAAGFATVFVLSPGSEQAIPLRQFKAGMRDDA